MIDYMMMMQVALLMIYCVKETGSDLKLYLSCMRRLMMTIMAASTDWKVMRYIRNF